jgi:hypothetical protein
VVGVDEAATDRDLDAYAKYIAVIYSVWVGVFDFVCGYTCADAIYILEVSLRLLVDDALRGLVISKTRREVGLREEDRG